MKLNVLYQSSALYAIPAAVSICSLLENNQDIEDICIWFVDVGLEQQDREGLTELANRYHRTITFMTSEETDRLLESNGVKKWSGSYATFYKIFNCSRLKNEDSVLYIDSDTVVLGSLKELCDYDFEEHACAMVGSGMTGAVKNFLELQNYYNAGLIFFNLKYWREHNIEQEFIDVICGELSASYTLIGDETLINKVLNGRIKKMPLKYNFESSWWLWGWNPKLYKELGFDKTAYYSVDEIREAKEHPVIGHYVDLTTGRPWDQGNDNPFRKAFAVYYEMLKPWKVIDMPARGIGANNKIVYTLKNVVKRMLPFSVRSKIGFKQHDDFWKNQISELK